MPWIGFLFGKSLGTEFASEVIFFKGNNDCITEGVVARLVVNDEKDL